MTKNHGTTGADLRKKKPRLATEAAPTETKSEPVLKTIHLLAERQRRFYAKETLSHSDLEELAYTNLEWEQCWELWCQNQAMLYAGDTSVPPRLRPAKVAMKPSKATAAPCSKAGTSLS